ncbi:hypothetical protein [Variovorax sp. LjRoot178]|uniref:hypothetical protein n=1 Tax=Variovorax sp. LjRoot178 TaxID=3342277 RepID=UPI003ED174AE
MSNAQAASVKAIASKHPARGGTPGASMLRGSALVWAGAAAAVLVLTAGVVVYLANQRGAEIARQRAEIAQQLAAGKLVQAFRASKNVLAMKDGSRQELVGATSFLLTTKPVAGEKATWLALGRTGSGIYFGQRFSEGPGGVVRAVTDAQEVSPEVALGELRAQIAASGADAEGAQAFLDAVSTGQPVEVKR